MIFLVLLWSEVKVTQRTFVRVVNVQPERCIGILC